MAKTWTVSWNGHEIVAENRWSGEKLYIDGARCDERSGFSLSSDLRGQIKGSDGAIHKVVAKFRQGSFGTKITCHLFVDDTWIGGDPV